MLPSPERIVVETDMNQQDVFLDHRANGRFELVVAGDTAYAEYRREAGRLVIDYVYAPPALRGSGAADRLMRHVVVTAAEERRDVQARCSYARAWLQAHQRRRDLPTE